MKDAAEQGLIGGKFFALPPAAPAVNVVKCDF